MTRGETAVTTGDQQRTHRSFFFDPRFAIGLGLVVASVIGVYAIVQSADRTSDVYAARSPLVAGQRVDADDLVVRSVRLGGADRLYLASDALPGDGAVATRSVKAGELVPASAIGSTASVNETSVVLRVKGDLAASIAPGTNVDVWSAAQTQRDRYDPPAVLVGGATVVRVIETDAMVASDDALSVEVRVPKKKVAAVLEAIANADAISLVPQSTAETASADAGSGK